MRYSKLWVAVEVSAVYSLTEANERRQRRVTKRKVANWLMIGFFISAGIAVYIYDLLWNF